MPYCYFSVIPGVRDICFGVILHVAPQSGFVFFTFIHKSSAQVPYTSPVD